MPRSAGANAASSVRPEPKRRWAAMSGVLAVGVALGVSELLSAAVRSAPSLLIAVGDAVIDSVPGWLERAAIAALGRYDKPVLIVSIIVVAALLGAGVGMLAARRQLLGVAGFAVFTAVAAAATLESPQAQTWPALLVAGAGGLAGIATLLVLVRMAPQGKATASTSAPSRRRFLLTGLSAAVVAIAGAAGGRWLSARNRVDQLIASVRIPPPASPAPPPPPGADLEIAGLTPLFVPNEDFYRIDTALRVPQVDPASWSLQIEGMVDRPYALTYAELMEMPQVEADITLSCVSNEVGGDLVGNARWQGVPLYVLLERAGVQTGGTQLLSRSVDGFTAGFPTITALDVRESMVAVAMNGEPLPAEHGFPARLVVPGLYGYVSATKWLSAIQLTDFSEVDGYWIPRGWAKEGPVKTQSRIDVPRPTSTVAAGTRPIAGVAWAPTRGIEAVEVRVDDGPWVPATLAASLNVDCWRQWVYEWDATPGAHRITVRATDGAGETQTDERTPVAPDGASGHHTIEVFVE